MHTETTLRSDPTDFPSRMAQLLSTVDVVDLDACVVRKTIGVTELAATAGLSRPTPCVEWTLHDLLDHMAAQHEGFAAASRGDADPAVWKPRSRGSDPVAAYRDSAERVLAAFSAEGVLDRSFPLPEFGPGVEFPGVLAIGFHFIDYVVHAWDVGRSLELAVEFEPEVLEPAYEIARAIPGGEVRLAPGAPFGPEVPWSGQGRTLDAIAAMLGRSPSWPD